MTTVLNERPAEQRLALNRKGREAITPLGATPKALLSVKTATLLAGPSGNLWLRLSG